jgi:hypothetical protein
MDRARRGKTTDFVTMGNDAMTRRRPPRPGYASAQEYVLLCTSGKDAEGRYYAGLHDYTHAPMWMHHVDINLAARMRGPGMASAVRALNRRGYIVERVPV